jgi:RNA polymerase sigma factor (sigma-70 family)
MAKRKRRGFNHDLRLPAANDQATNAALIAQLPSSRDALITGNMRIAFESVGEVLWKWHWLEPEVWADDLISVAFVGLTRAVDHIDPSYPAATFYSYVKRWIDGAIVHYLSTETEAKAQETTLTDDEHEWRNASDPSNAEFYEDDPDPVDHVDGPRGEVEWERVGEDGRDRDRRTAFAMDLQTLCKQYPPTWRALEMLEMRVAKYTVREIADKLDVPKSTVQARLDQIRADAEKLW